MAGCRKALRETSDVISNVTFVLSTPCLKVRVQCESERAVLNRGALSLSACQLLGKCNLEAINGFLGIAFNQGLSEGLETWREQPTCSKQMLTVQQPAARVAVK